MRSVLAIQRQRITPGRYRHCSRNSCSRPEIAAMPRFACSPIAGRHVEKNLREIVLLQFPGNDISVEVIGNRNSTPPKPASAASLKRSRNGTSLNIVDRLAAKRGIIYLLPDWQSFGLQRKPQCRNFRISVQAIMAFRSRVPRERRAQSGARW